MGSTELNLGISTTARPSSRVLKPPGGGHSNIFGEPDVKPNPPRPKYNQQNSSNLNIVMNTTDPNEAVVKINEELEKVKANEAKQGSAEAAAREAANNNQNEPPKDNEHQQGRGRVPPGGFSSGLW